jgi:RNA polymerase sigma factor (sigma-70 family)
MEADPDAELMLRLKNGEDWILNELMTRWQQPLVAFIYRYIGRETEALDLAQETFVRVYETRHRYAVRGKFSTWLFTIAANLCRNYLRGDSAGASRPPKPGIRKTPSPLNLSKVWTIPPINRRSDQNRFRSSERPSTNSRTI